jgi:hypothetical protein
MADLARSAVVFNDEWSEGRNRRFFVRDVTMTLTGQGGATNKIPASVLGFLKINRCDSAVKSDNSAMYVGVPNADGSALLLSPGAAGPLVPTDVTATVKAIVVGQTL